jgi:hypothetical protein
LTEIIQDMCNLVAQAIEKYLPDQYSQLNLVCSLLSMGENLITAPLTSLVLNIQCTTIGHQDGEDVPICIVLSFGQFQNEQFVQYETGWSWIFLLVIFLLSPLQKSHTLIFIFLASEGHLSYILMHIQILG